MRALAKRGRLGRVLIPALLLAALLVLCSHPLAGAASDVWGNVGPSPQLGDGGIAGRYPLTNYSLDQHFDAVEASLTGGVDVSGVPAMIAWFFASLIWLATNFLANLLITLFGFAFSLDLVNGSQATGGEGALAPVSQAIHAIYSDVFGAPWLVLAIAVAGIWAMWKALVQRRYSETAGALGLSLIYVVLALFFVAQPGTTIGSVSKWTNQMSGAFLSISSHGSPSSARQAKEDTANQLFDLLVFKPWVVLNFGGLEHCVRAGTGSGDSDPASVAVRPLSSNPERDAALARRLQRGTEVTADGKVCINNANKYAHRFLRYGLGAPEKDERDREYDALNDGDASDLPDAGRSGYRLGVADKPVTDAMEEGGQFQRLLLALVLFVGELGAVLLLGSLAIGIILAQVLLLLLLAFSPVALVAAAIPGRGHDFFKGWLQKLGGYLLRKAAYSLILTIVLAVNGALATATAQLGWLMSFGLQSLFFWAVFLQRKTLADSLIGIATGPGAPGREGTLRVLGVYAGARMGSRALRPLRRSGRSGGGGAGGLFGRRGGPGGAGSGGPRRAPLFGTSDSAPVGGGVPSLDAPGPKEQQRSAARSGEAAQRNAGSPARASAAGSKAPPAEGVAAKDVPRRPRHSNKKKTPPREAGQEKTKAPALPSGRASSHPGARRSARPPPLRRRGRASPRSCAPSASAALRLAGRRRGSRASLTPPPSPLRPSASAAAAKAVPDERGATSRRRGPRAHRHRRSCRRGGGGDRHDDGDPRLGDRLHRRGRIGGRRPGDQDGGPRDSGQAPAHLPARRAAVRRRLGLPRLDRIPGVRPRRLCRGQPLGLRRPDADRDGARKRM
ncbi:MAG TPA: type IV secretion system protein [Solirubrobacterales bacterium]|jgi:hypothetical protein|nr:type IV secretion system protein [Solirubrobacterales bacterium]